MGVRRSEKLVMGSPMGTNLGELQGRVMSKSRHTHTHTNSIHTFVLKEASMQFLHISL